MVNRNSHMDKGGFSLVQLQNWMQSMILERNDGGNAGIVKPVLVADVVHSSRRLSAERHLDIYMGSYIARLRECMRTQFSALAYALGPDLFQAFADQYLEACPSNSYTLNELGHRFPAFLEITRPDAALEQKESWPDFMIELAGFEYELSVIFDKDASDYDAIATENTPDEALSLTPVFELFAHHYPICKYYLDFRQKSKPELPFPEESFCAVTRENYRLGLFEIKPAQYYFLSRVKQGASIQSAKEYLSSEFHFDAGAVDTVWKEWKKFFVANGFFVMN